ncbi:MAG: DoxX family protein [Chlamydiales bacterium]
MSGLFALLGRMCLSLIFILSAASQVANWQGTETLLLNGLCDQLSYTLEMPSVQNLLNSLIPWAGALLIFAILFQFIGGLLLFFGLKVRFAAFLLILFLIPCTLVFHSFWYLEGTERDLQMIMFLKNLSIFGGLLCVLSIGKGAVPKKIKNESEA